MTSQAHGVAGQARPRLNAGQKRKLSEDALKQSVRPERKRNVSVRRQSASPLKKRKVEAPNTYKRQKKKNRRCLQIEKACKSYHGC